MLVGRVYEDKKGGLRLYIPKEAADQLKQLKHRDYVLVKVMGDASFMVKKAKIVVEG